MTDFLFLMSTCDKLCLCKDVYSALLAKQNQFSQGAVHVYRWSFFLRLNYVCHKVEVMTFSFLVWLCIFFIAREETVIRLHPTSECSLVVFMLTLRQISFLYHSLVPLSWFEKAPFLLHMLFSLK